MKRIELTNEEIQFLENKFKTNNYHGDSSLETHTFIHGNNISNIILTAPHSVKTEKLKKDTKEIVSKQEDIYTGAIVLALQSFLGCHIMVRNNYNDTKIDTNFYNEALQKYIKKQEIKYLLDIHGAALSNLFDIALGTGNGKYIDYKEIYKDIIRESFMKHGINNIDFNSKFNALEPKTLCFQVYHGCSIKTTQLEIHRSFRDPIKNISKTNMFLNGMKDYIITLDKIIYRDLENDEKTKNTKKKDYLSL